MELVKYDLISGQVFSSVSGAGGSLLFDDLPPASSDNLGEKLPQSSCLSFAIDCHIRAIFMCAFVPLTLDKPGADQMLYMQICSMLK